MKIEKIFTINARNGSILEIFQGRYHVSLEKIGQLILGMFDKAICQLEYSGIDYKSLGKALIPSKEKSEVALIFDITLIQSCDYGYEVANLILPLLHEKSAQSILVGDLIPVGLTQNSIKEICTNHIILNRDLPDIHSSLLYCFYLNNISANDIRKLHINLKANDSYIGYIDTTFFSLAKLYFSKILVNKFLKVGRFLICVCGDDENFIEVSQSYPQKFGNYRTIYVQDVYYRHFLSFKILSPVLEEDKFDLELGISSLSGNIRDLGNLEIHLDKGKFDYLIANNRLSRTNRKLIDNYDRLKTFLEKQILSSYFYNFSLEHLRKFRKCKFNTLLEFPSEGKKYPERLVVAFEYNDASNVYRVVTIT